MILAYFSMTSLKNLSINWWIGALSRVSDFFLDRLDVHFVRTEESPFQLPGPNDHWSTLVVLLLDLPTKYPPMTLWISKIRRDREMEIGWRYPWPIMFILSYWLPPPNSSDSCLPGSKSTSYFWLQLAQWCFLNIHSIFEKIIHIYYTLSHY